MKKFDVINAILGERINNVPQSIATAFAPTNIALCKYWGKRDTELNLPKTSSLSITLDGKGTTTTIRVVDSSDNIIFNGKPIHSDSTFSRRLLAFLDLFRLKNPVRFHIECDSNIPLSAGLASSASGFASIVLALNQLYGWQLSLEDLSILARLGSGSACRSLWNGFVEWKMGLKEDGMDSHGYPIPKKWPELCMGLLLINRGEKAISSRSAMERTQLTSPLYALWPKKVNDDLLLIKEAIATHDFSLLGKTAESNAMTMHAIMLSAWPSICYSQPATLAAMQQIWKLRQEGLEIYFTQDAGPNLKLLFLSDEIKTVNSIFSDIDTVQF